MDEEVDEATAVFIACGGAFCEENEAFLLTSTHTKMDYDVNINIALGFRCGRRGMVRWAISPYFHGEPTT